MNKKRYDDYCNTLAVSKYQCKNCGRKEIIKFNEDRKLCTWCGHYIYKNEILENKYNFKNIMTRKLKQQNAS